MCDTILDKNQVCRNGSDIFQDQSCCCKGCQRVQKFLQLLNQLTIASKAEHYDEEISATVSLISADNELLAPLEIALSTEFDRTKHTIDVVAQEYLKQASKTVQHLIPVKTPSDGNCLFHSIVSFMLDSDISAAELRVRTIIELVKNKIHYINLGSNLIISSFSEALRSTCSNNSFCGLYEVIALASVLQCEVQSVYPYIDYRAEMKAMNTVYKPVETSVPSKGKVIIFWSSTEDEVSTRTRSGNNGFWNPNHFVSLLQQYRSSRTESHKRVGIILESPQKTTVKNNQVSSIRSPEFSPPPNVRKHECSLETLSTTIHASPSNPHKGQNDDQRDDHRNADSTRKRVLREKESDDERNARLGYQRKRSASIRSSENEDQRNTRLRDQRKRSASNRSSDSAEQRNTRRANLRKRLTSYRLDENEDQRNVRLSEQKKRSASNRSSENEQQRNARLTDQRERSATNRLNKNGQRKSARLEYRQQHSEATESFGGRQRMGEQHQRMEIQHHQRVLEKKQQVSFDQYNWPSAIPTQLKEYCLQDFCDRTSMSALQQSTCIICNMRASTISMKEFALENIPNSQRLSCHEDLMDVISKILQTTQNEEETSFFCALSNAVFYKKGYNTLTKTANICYECYHALSKNKVPMFSAANKMWIGDVPLVLQQLTIAEEKLISLYRHSSCVIKLQSPFRHHSTAQAALKGNVITFMHDMPNIVTSLPLDVEDLCDTLKIVFVGAHIPNRIELRRICGVSQQKIRNALLWLKTHNHMYHMIPINEMNIAKLPDDDVPESIWATIERAENMADADAERAGFTRDPLVDAIIQGEVNTKNVIPMSTSAVLDVNGTTIASKDISVHLLQKVRKTSTKPLSDPTDQSADDIDNEDVYIIPRSHIPVKDCYNSELFLGLFPTLFPYGSGAPYDSSRPTAVSLNQHIRYLLAYDDQRFERHHSFIFVMFNVMQRRQACWNASLMASRPYFRDVATDLQTLTSKEIEIALINATKNTFSSITNPRINMLLKQIRTVGGNVMGSAYSRTALRTQIHALIFNQGLPSIFMTVNPADIHSRIALYFAGVDLDLDKILSSTIPSTYERAQIIAAHPVATARFFNVLISSILKCMVEGGVLGPIKAYFGTVENQGRGSLHLHILIWLDHDLTPSKIKELTQNEEFRNNLLNYLEDIIKQDLSNFDSETFKTNEHERQQTVDLISSNELASTSIENLEQFDSNITMFTQSIMPTPQPLMPNFTLNFKKDVARLVNSSNIHHHTSTCYKYSKKHGNPTCRMRMPRRIENVSSINIESGEIKLKRLHETINNFNEYIISACRSNMDIKYIFSGSDAKALVYYITDYVTKSSLSFHDTFSLVLKAVQSIEKQKQNVDISVDPEEKSRRLVLRCYNTLASQQELSGAQVASYLMGWPDHYTTHEFVNLFLIGIENYLQAMLLEAQLKQQRQTTIGTEIESEDSCLETEEQFLLQPAETNNKYVYVNTRVDYQYRSGSLDNMCLYDYISFYRKKPIDAKDRKQLKVQLEVENTESRRGRPCLERESFQVGHPQATSHVNVKRTKPVVPVLLGPPVPRKDRDDTRERYCRSILTLFVPWRSIENICDVDQTWEEAFQVRQTRISPTSWKIIDNIQLLQECKSDRDEHLQQVIELAQTESSGDYVRPRFDESDTDNEDNEVFDVLETIDIDAIPAVKELGSTIEQTYFDKTVQAVDRANRFTNIRNSRIGPANRFIYTSKPNEIFISNHKHLVPATRERIQLNNRWQRTIKDEKDRRRNASIVEQTENDFVERNDAEKTKLDGVDDDNIWSILDSYTKVSDSECIVSVTKITAPNEISRENVAQQFTLNKNQKAAFMIITGHLDQLDKLNTNDQQDQLIMCVPGCGGTGKSQLIRAITAYFAQTNRAQKLRKLAPTSVAAAEIEGMTIHSFLGEGRHRRARATSMKRPGQMTLENAWRFVEYIILDEMSMVGLSLLARLNKLVTTAKHCDPMIAMGGINLILFGDYIQYSPVFDKPLYYNFPTTMANSSNDKTKPPTENEIQQRSARALILQINCVVILEQQMRTKDLAYQSLLNRVRNGDGTHEDWLLLRTRVIGIGLHISLNDPPWNEAPILVYRNELRTELNNRAVINRAYEMGQSPTVLIAADTIKAKRQIDLPDLTRRLLALPDNKTEHLPGYLPLVSGMPVLLQENIACELGLSNGTQGIFRELIYDQTVEPTNGSDEGVFTTDTVFVRNPQYALVEIPKSKLGKLNSLDLFIIPIPVVEKTFDVNLEKLYADKGPIMKMLKDKKLKTTISVKRKTLPLIPAYSITTHKSQGQTLSKIVIDLNMPPGMVEVASAYVPLSRVQQLTDLILLQDFSINALQVKPSKSQIAELNRLVVIFEQTKQRYRHYFI